MQRALFLDDVQRQIAQLHGEGEVLLQQGRREHLLLQEFVFVLRLEITAHRLAIALIEDAQVTAFLTDELRDDERGRLKDAAADLGLIETIGDLCGKLAKCHLLILIQPDLLWQPRRL